MRKVSLALVALMILSLTACTFQQFVWSAILMWTNVDGDEFAFAHNHDIFFLPGIYLVDGVIGGNFTKVKFIVKVIDGNGQVTDTQKVNAKVDPRTRRFKKKFLRKKNVNVPPDSFMIVRVKTKGPKDHNGASLTVSAAMNSSLVAGTLDASDVDVDIEFLVDDVAELVAAGTLPRRQGDSLTSSLQTALKLLGEGRDIRTRHQVLSFIEQVNESVSSGTLSSEEGKELTLAADDIVEYLQLAGR